MKTWHIECVRGADVTYTTVSAKTAKEAQAYCDSHALGTRYDCRVLGEWKEPPRRPYDDHNAKMRAADAMIEAMRPWRYDV